MSEVGNTENDDKIDYYEMNHLLAMMAVSWMIAKLTLRDLVLVANTDLDVKKAPG